MRCITGWHRSEAVCFAHHGTNSAVHKGRSIEISYIMFKLRHIMWYIEIVPIESAPLNIPPKKWSLPQEFINMLPPQREPRSRFRQPKGSPPLDFVNSRGGLPLEFINIYSQKFPFSRRFKISGNGIMPYHFRLSLNCTALVFLVFKKICKPNTVQCISRPRTVVYAASVCRVKKWLIEGAIGPQKSGLCYHSELKSRISFKIPLFGPQHEKILDLIHSKVKNKGQ